MTRSDFKKMVMERIDEVGVNETVSLNFPIDGFILESANQLLASIPIENAANLTDFSTNTITSNSDGSGSVELPTNFLSLHSFKMKGWSNIVTKSHKASSELLFKQQFNATKGSSTRPIVIIHGNELLYFSLPADSTHIIECAKALCSIDSIDELAETYTDAASWLCASKVLNVLNEQTAAQTALAQYNQLITLLKRDEL